MSSGRQQLQQSLRQQQTLTPMQIQYVRLLEMNGPEIEEEVREALDENPALEAVDDSHHEEEEYGESAEQMQMADYATADDIPSAQLARRGADRDYEPVVADHGDTLMEIVMRQLAESGLPEEELTIASHIAGNIDDNGYMTRPLQSIADDIAIDSGFEPEPDAMKRVWQAIRACEPAGVAAVDLRDCLLLQLRRRSDSNDPAVKTATEIVEHYFDIFSKMHRERLQTALGADDETFARAIEVIRGLNPKPGALVSSAADDDRMRQITPDFQVEVEPDSQKITLTLPNNLPHLQIEKSFAADTPVPRGRGSADAALFLRQRRDEAQTFIKVLSMRQETLFRVMSAIIQLQRDFFLTDDRSRLHPMILKDVAALTGYDLSVISRATAGKYVATQRGVYPLRLFFSERPGDENDASSHEVLEAIRNIIDKEDKRSPLPDAEIAQMLASRGYKLARRTVAKYRERLGLPVCRLRRHL